MRLALADLPVAKLVHPVEALTLGEQMGDDQYPHARIPAPYAHLPEVHIRLPVETGIGLVEKQQVGFVHKRDRKVELLPGSTRKLLDPIAAVFLKVELCE